jgi:hypothetical protein
MEEYSWQSWAACCMGVTALHSVFLGALSRGDFTEETKQKCFEITKLLVENGAAVNIRTGPCTFYSEGILTVSITSTNYTLLLILCSYT